MTDTEIRRGMGRAPDTRRTEVLPRMSATFAGACLLLHIALVFVAGSQMLSMSLPMLGLAALCGGCAVIAWRRRCRDRELGLMAVVAGVMVSFHLILMSGHAGQAIPGSMADSHAMASMPGMSGMSDAGGGENGVSAVAELLMHAGVVFAGIAGLMAMGALAQRRLAPGHIRNTRDGSGRGPPKRADRCPSIAELSDGHCCPSAFVSHRA